MYISELILVMYLLFAILYGLYRAHKVTKISNSKIKFMLSYVYGMVCFPILIFPDKKK